MLYLDRESKWLTVVVNDTPLAHQVVRIMNYKLPCRIRGKEKSGVMSVWRQVDVSVALEKANDVAGALEKAKLHSTVCLKGVQTMTFRFVAHTERLGRILHKLAKIGCGVSFGQITVTQLSMMVPFPQKKTGTLTFTHLSSFCFFCLV